MSKPPSEEKLFIDAYAKKLAQALIENDKFQKETLLSASHSFTKQEIEGAYLALCYDDPILKNDSICRELALEILACFSHSKHCKGVTPPRSKVLKKGQSQKRGLTNLGLSDHFVNGVLQTTGNNRNQSQPKPAASLREENHDYMKAYNGEQMVSATSASRGYVELAFVSFGKGPLHCCNALLDLDRNKGGEGVPSKLKATRSFLGTYNGKDTSEDNQQDGRGKDVEDATNQFLDSMAHQPDSEKGEMEDTSTIKDEVQAEDDNVDDNDSDSMKEMVAAESDPDDYDYGDDRYSSQADKKIPGDFQSFTQFLNVQSLCQSKLLTVHEMSHRVKSLLSELSYRRITMGTKSWKELDVSNTLVELTFRLLNCLGADDLDGLGMMFNSPLIALRDRALDGSYGHDALDAFLDLIRKLLMSQSADVGVFASTNREESKELSPARVIGMGSLASLCSSLDLSGITKKKQRIKIRTMIMECFDAFIDCIEFVRPKKNDISSLASSSLPAWVRVAMALSPIIDFVTGLKSRSDFGAVEDLANPLSNSEAQSMLQSGFFREMILLYAQTECTDNKETQEAANATDVARELLLRQIFVMSAQSQILAKYVSRVPELTNILYSDGFRTNNTVDAMLWYSLLSKMKSSSRGPQILMKGVASMSGKDMNEKGMSLFMKLCDNSVDCMASRDATDLSLLHDFIRFSNCLCQIPYIVECWVAVISEMGKQKQVTDALTAIIKALPKLKLASTPKDEGKGGKQKPSHDEIEIDTSTKASIRKGCKSLLLYLENMEHSKLSRISSKTD